MAKENDEQDASASDRGRGIYGILKSIDERLEIVVKLLGYISILVITPFVFFLTYIGVDVNSVLGIKAESSSIRTAIERLEQSGWEPSSSEALRALRQSDSSFDLFMTAEIYPDPEEAHSVISDLLSVGSEPPSRSIQFRNWINENEQLLATIVRSVREVNSVAELTAQEVLSDRLSPCRRIESFLRRGKFSFEISGVDSCSDSIDSGLFVSFLSRLNVAAAEWSNLVGAERVQVLDVGSTSELVRTLTGTELNSDKINRQFNYTALVEAPALSLHRFYTLVAVISSQKEEGFSRLKLAFLEQGMPRPESGYLPVVFLDAKVDEVGDLLQCKVDANPHATLACEIRFVATQRDGGLEILSIEQLKPYSDPIFVQSVQRGIVEWRASGYDSAYWPN